MRICFFGDSFVNGTGDPHCLGWVGQVCAGRGVTVYNLGIRRDASGDVARRWRGEAGLRLPPEADGRLVFSFGANDCVDGGPPPAETLATTRRVLGEAAIWLPTLFVGPPPRGEPAGDSRVAALSDGLAALCRELAVPFLEVFRPLAGCPAWAAEAAAGDGAHPAAGGYQALAGLVESWPAWQAWFTGRS